MHRPRLLYVDAYDSFSNNVIALLETSLKAYVHVVKIDDKKLLYSSKTDFVSFLHQFEGIVVGPGPGNPKLAKDIGWVNRIWAFSGDEILPVLGICLGFQSLCLAFGAQVIHLKDPRHGLVLQVSHCGEGIFQGLEMFNATMYHSLHVDLGYSSIPCRKISATLSCANLTEPLWKPSPRTSLLEPLAWDLADDVNGPVLMAAKHRLKPFWGVQFHPESITTGTRISPEGMVFGLEGATIIQGWWRVASEWRTKSYQIPRLQLEIDLTPCGSPIESVVHSPTSSSELLAEKHYINLHHYIQPSRSVFWNSVYFRGNITVQQICDEMKITKGQAVILESGLTPDGRPLREDTGRYSIIGVLEPNRPVSINQKLEPFPEVLVNYASGHQLAAPVTDFWAYLKRWMQLLMCSGGTPKIPFWGGLIGFITYEAGLETIGVHGAKLDNHKAGEAGQGWEEERPTSTFALVMRSIVVDHLANQVYVQSIRRDDEYWVDITRDQILAIYTSPEVHKRDLSDPDTDIFFVAQVHRPNREQYERKVLQCQAAIRDGDSYELCLTDQTQVHVEKAAISPNYAWDLYRRMVVRNSAPFAAYLHFESGGLDVSILSSSPERFLSWSRTGRCQFRPIKGTVKKEPGMTLRDAEGILKPSLNAKDVAENLMITDLIRHDIHGVVGAGNVSVPKLFGVEEAQTVFHLVSVIEGQLPIATSTSRGIDVLAASLPPGSMTGAPKKRSCELLYNIEGGRSRGIYSGVLGYLDVGGGGDFSVVIRTAHRWSDQVDEEGNHIWTIGAGGAVIAQSTPEGEVQEMRAKLDSALRAFVSHKR